MVSQPNSLPNLPSPWVYLYATMLLHGLFLNVQIDMGQNGMNMFLLSLLIGAQTGSNMRNDYAEVNNSPRNHIPCPSPHNHGSCNILL